MVDYWTERINIKKNKNFLNGFKDIIELCPREIFERITKVILLTIYFSYSKYVGLLHREK
jgi:hypothetical protein